MANFKDTDMQLIIGRILRIGVFASIAIAFLGGIVYIARHGQETVDYTHFKGVPDFVSHIPTLIHGVFTLRGRAIIQTGIILLIATPVIRVLFSTIGFAIEKDRLYTIISAIVLLIILFSMLSGHAG
ncbi:DUF1634 domain-containing protein [Mucilaginibacter gynuensis]|uniref:DUF1634 domain-containing protein n=1 Tax=Mucilaginibacter gynuensis TaxID=1302236 RepID=A0ABP8GP40_9SPHI